MTRACSVRRASVFVLIGLAGALLLPASAAGQAASESHADYARVLQRYCAACHNARLQTAGLVFEEIDLAHPSDAIDVWEKVVLKLRGRTMPPPGRPRPDEATYDRFAAWLETALDRAATANPNPGRPLLHRMNRAEYRNAVRDLLGFTVDVDALPPDDEAHGFDNIADALSVSPLLLESYVTTARKVARLAIGDPAAPPVTARYAAPPRLSQSAHLDGLPLGTRGGLRVDPYLPADATYELRIRLKRNGGGSINGIAEEHRLDLRLDGEQIAQFDVGSKGIYTPINKETNNQLVAISRAFTGRRAHAPAPADHGRRAYDHGRVRGQAGGPVLVVWRPPGRSVGGSDSADRPVRRASRHRDGQPRARVRLLPRHRGRGKNRARGRSCPGSDGVPTGDRSPATSRRPLLDFYRDGRQRGGFESGIELALRFLLASPAFVFPGRDRADGHRARHGLSGSRPGPGVTTRLLPVEQPPGRGAPDGRRGGPSLRPAGAAATGPPHARRRPRVRTGRELRRAVALSPERGYGGAGRHRVPRLRREPAPRPAPRDRAVLRARHARGSRHPGADDRRLHLRQRAAGESTTGLRASTATGSAASRWPTSTGAACWGTAASSPSRRIRTARRPSCAANGCSTICSGAPPPPPPPEVPPARRERAGSRAPLDPRAAGAAPGQPGPVRAVTRRWTR